MIELRECPTFDRYRVSECGTVVERYSLYREEWRTAPQHTSSRGYKSVAGRRKSAVLVHQLVADAWVDDRSNHVGAFVCHHDDDKNNNIASNLYYGDAKTNGADCIRNGHFIPNFVEIEFDESALHDICSRYEGGETLREVASSHDVSTAVISRVLRHRGVEARKASQGRGPKRGMSEPEVMVAYCLWRGDGYTQRQIGEMFDVTGC